MFGSIKIFTEQISQAQTVTDVENLLKPLLDQFHITHYVCTHVYGLACLADRKPMFGMWDTDWVRHYLRQGYYREDAVAFYPNGIDGDGAPYYWSDLIARTDLSKAQRHIFKEAWDAGMHDGLVIPFQPTPEELASLVLSGPRFRKDLVLQGVLHTASLQAYWRVRAILLRDHATSFPPNRLSESREPSLDLITNTEKQVISLLADDLRAPEIAKVTNTSVSTVRKHLASAKRKFGVDNTEGLVATALRNRLIL